MYCQVCQEPAFGKHFGAVVCRACAAFFRRAVGSRISKRCKNENRCVSFKRGCFTCKYCRLQKCFEVGMNSENFQFDRDNHNRDKRLEALAERVPETMDTFCGRSSLIVFSAPSTSDDSSTPESSRTFINLQYLLDEAMKVLRQGPASPIHSKSRLEKLSFGLRQVKGAVTQSNGPSEFGMNEAVAQLQQGVLKFTEWLTYFDEFQLLPQARQIQMLQGTWTIFNRLESLANTALSVKRKINEDIIIKMKTDTLIFKLDPVKLDTSWLSKYTLE